MKKINKYSISHLSKSLENNSEIKYPESEELKRYEEISPGLAKKIIKVHSDQISFKKSVVLCDIIRQIKRIIEIVLIYSFFHKIF